MKYYNCLAIIVILFCSTFSGFAQEEDIYRINKEQKVFELSTIWKELTYNFANMDNCNVDLDSLYRAYIPIVQNTENDIEYIHAIQRFMGHFNNGHTAMYHPEYLFYQAHVPGIKTEIKGDKILIQDVIARHADKIEIGDEVIAINGMNVIDYFEKYRYPYICTSNPENKLFFSMFGMFTYISLKSTPLELKIKKSSGVKDVTIYTDAEHFNFLKDSTIKADIWIGKNTTQSNLFIQDTINKWAYIRLTACDENLHTFYQNHYLDILKSENFILDISSNMGGNSEYTTVVYSTLINNDTIYPYSQITRNNNACLKSHATFYINNYPEQEVSEFLKTTAYPYFYNNSFEALPYSSELNYIHDSLRYKGNVYVMTGKSTGSAAENLVLRLTQESNITFLGEKTAGAMGMPLNINLPSGMRISINTVKTYDLQGKDVSSGFTPDYEMDFSSLNEIESSNELLQKLIKAITEKIKSEK